MSYWKSCFRHAPLPLCFVIFLVSALTVPGQDEKQGHDQTGRMTVDRLVRKLAKKRQDLQTLACSYGPEFSGKPEFYRQGIIRYKKDELYLNRYVKTGKDEPRTFLSSFFVGPDRAARKWNFNRLHFAGVFAHRFSRRGDGRMGPSFLAKEDRIRLLAGVYQFLLVPERIREVGKLVNITRTSEKKEHVYRVTKQVPLKKGNDRATKYTFVFRLDPVRVQRVIVHFPRTTQTVEMQVTERTKLDGISIPVRFRLKGTAERRGHSRLKAVTFSNVTVNKNQHAFRVPEWVRDDALPKPAFPTENISKPGKRKREASRYIRYVNQIWREIDTEVPSNSRFSEAKWKNAIDRGLEHHPDSTLLNEYQAAAHLSKHEFDTVEKALNRSWKKASFQPRFSFVIGQQFRRISSYEKARAAFQDAQRDPLLKPLAARFRTLSRLATVQSPEQFARVLGTYFQEKRTLPDGKQLLNHLVSPLLIRVQGSSRTFIKRRGWLRQHRSSSFIKKLLANQDGKALSLLKARFHVKNGQPKKAARLYKKLWTFPFVRPEAKDVIRQYKLKAQPLVNHVHEQLRIPVVLSQLAAKRFRQGKTDRAIQLVERVKKQFAQKDGIQHSNDEFKLPLILKHLARNGRKKLGRQLVLRYAELGGHFEGEQLIKRIKRCFQDPKKLILLVRHLSGDTARRKFLSDARSVDLLLDRFREGTVERPDMKLAIQIALDGYSGSGVKREKIIRLLRKGSQKFPVREDLYRFLGRYYAKADQYNRAIDAYDEYLNREKHVWATNLPNVSLDQIDQTKTWRFEDCHTSMERFVWLCRQQGRIELARKQIRALLQHVKEQPTSHLVVRKHVLVAISYDILGLEKQMLKQIRHLFIRMHGAKENTHESERKMVSTWLIVELARKDRIPEALVALDFARSSFDEKKVRRVQTRLRDRLGKRHLRRFLGNRTDGKPEDVNADRVHGLINQLGSRSFRKRTKAMNELGKLGSKAFYFLNDALDRLNPEVRNRVRKLIRKQMFNAYRTKFER